MLEEWNTVRYGGAEVHKKGQTGVGAHTLASLKII